MSTQARTSPQTSPQTSPKTWQGAGTSILLAFLILSTSLLYAEAAQTTELVMFESKSCHVCKQFHREVGPDYNASRGARIFPLRMIDIDDGTVDIVLQRPVTMTPTFIFVDKGREIARVVGFPGRKYFFQMVDGAAEEMAKIQAKAEQEARSKSEGL